MIAAWRIRIRDVLTRGRRFGGLGRIERSWVRCAAALTVAGCWLAPLGFGRSRIALAAFAVAFAVLSVPLWLRVLRPAVRLIDDRRAADRDAPPADLQVVARSLSVPVDTAIGGRRADRHRLPL